MPRHTRYAAVCASTALRRYAMPMPCALPPLSRYFRRYYDIYADGAYATLADAWRCRYGFDATRSCSPCYYAAATPFDAAAMIAAE